MTIGIEKNMTYKIQFDALSDVEYDKLIQLKQDAIKYKRYLNLAPVSKGMIAVLVASKTNPNSLDMRLGKQGRNAFLSWLFEREIETSKVGDEKGLRNNEAFAMLMLATPIKRNGQYLLSAKYIETLDLIAKVFSMAEEGQDN